ncbi:MAG TPA: nucleotide exchange factor GrpE [Chthoniobacterales bacterium]
MNAVDDGANRMGQPEPAVPGSAKVAEKVPSSDFEPRLTPFETTEGNREVERPALETVVEDLRGEVEKYKDIAMRSVADLDNYRKRVSREKEEAARYANAGFLERLVPILDNFELGLQAAKASSSGSAVLDGMSMVYRQLQDFLSGSGVETIDATGQRFNPNFHEAIAQEESADVAEGTVLRQVRKGYRLRDRLLRPANVVVARAPAAREGVS